MWGRIYSAKAITPMTVAMMMFTALSLIESASIPASFNLRTAEAIQSAAAVSVAPKYRGACAGLDAVGACLAAARCSVIDENELGGPTTCGDAIAGRVYSF